MQLDAAQAFKVLNFLCHVLPSGALVLQTKAGVVKVTDPAMRDLLEELDRSPQSHRRLTRQELETRFGPRVGDALGFLLSYGVLRPAEPTNYRVEGFYVCSTSPLFRELAERILGSSLPLRGWPVSLGAVDAGLPSGVRTALVCFLNPYVRRLARGVVRHVRASGQVTVMSYVYNGLVYIDNVYCSRWHNPCHLCNMGHLETQLRVSLDGNLTYQHLVDLVYQEDEDFAVGLDLDALDVAKVVCALANVLDRFFVRSRGLALGTDESPEDVNYSTLLDLQRNTITRDVATYWELCDCYE